MKHNHACTVCPTDTTHHSQHQWNGSGLPSAQDDSHDWNLHGHNESLNNVFTVLSEGESACLSSLYNVFQHEILTAGYCCDYLVAHSQSYAELAVFLSCLQVRGRHVQTHIQQILTAIITPFKRWFILSEALLDMWAQKLKGPVPWLICLWHLDMHTCTVFASSQMFQSNSQRQHWHNGSLFHVLHLTAPSTQHMESHNRIHSAHIL